jgi:hypothetical protein
MNRFNRLLLLMLFVALPVLAQDVTPLPPLRSMMQLPITSQKWCLNISGDCVQDSNTMVGLHVGDAAQMTLLWDTEYGQHERGGADPSRVARYCRERQIEIYNVTGRRFEDTAPWIDFAARTHRFAAVGCFGSHFQTLWGRDFEHDLFFVQNNWSGTFGKPYVYSRAQFKAHHEDSGPWVVIPRRPPPAPYPIYFRWWEDESVLASAGPAIASVFPDAPQPLTN